MADNITIKDGNGANTTLGTKDLGSGVHAPKHYNVAGEEFIGFIASPADIISVTPTLDTSIYASGDLMFEQTTIASAVRVNGGRAILQSLTVIDEDDQGVAFDLWISSANSDFGTLNSAPSISDAVSRDLLGYIAIATGDYKDLGGVKVATLRNIGLLVEANSTSNSIYAAGVTGGTPTYTASGVKIIFGFVQG